MDLSNLFHLIIFLQTLSSRFEHDDYRSWNNNPNYHRYEDQETRPSPSNSAVQSANAGQAVEIINKGTTYAFHIFACAGVDCINPILTKVGATSYPL
jgi:hypothetical protein